MRGSAIIGEALKIERRRWRNVTDAHIRTPEVMRLAVTAVMAVAMLLHSGAGHAIEPLKVFRGALLIEGPIQRGDFEKLRSFLADRVVFEKIRRGVFLASPGGEVMESIKIGYLLRALNLRTLLPGLPNDQTNLIRAGDLKRSANYLCGSACFFLYVAGVDRNPPRLGRLAIHRPVVKSRFNLPTSQEAKAVATRGIEDAIGFYLRQMDVPDRLEQFMFSIPNDKIHWVTESEFSEFVRWTSPVFTQELRRDCAALLPDVHAPKLLACREDAAANLAARSWETVFKRR
jgi:hypothetical protein